MKVTEFLVSPYLFFKATRDHQAACKRHSETSNDYRAGTGTFEATKIAFDATLEPFSRVFKYSIPSILTLTIYFVLIMTFGLAIFGK